MITPKTPNLSDVSTDELWEQLTGADRSLDHFGIHPLNIEIRAKLQAQRDAAKAELQLRGYIYLR